jgi:hypothetical protein
MRQPTHAQLLAAIAAKDAAIHRLQALAERQADQLQTLTAQTIGALSLLKEAERLNPLWAQERASDLHQVWTCTEDRTPPAPFAFLADERGNW